MSQGVAPPVEGEVVVSGLLLWFYSFGLFDNVWSVRTFEDERPLSIEVNVVTCGVVDPPRIVDPVHLRSPDITASRSCLVGPDDFGLAGLQTADGFGTCDADV